VLASPVVSAERGKRIATCTSAASASCILQTHLPRTRAAGASHGYLVFMFIAANMTAKVFSQPSCRLCRSVHHQRDGRVAAQGFGIGAGFVRFVHDALNLGTLDSRELRMQRYRQAIAALVILDQAHQCPYRGILDRGAELFGRVASTPRGNRRNTPPQTTARDWAASLGAFSPKDFPA